MHSTCNMIILIKHKNYINKINFHGSPYRFSVQNSSPSKRKGSPFSRQWRTCPGWTVRVSWVPCAFWAEECYGGEDSVWNWYGPAIQSELMIGSMNILLIACSLISNIRNQSFMYSLIFGKLFGTRTDVWLGWGIVGNSLRSAICWWPPSVWTVNREGFFFRNCIIYKVLIDFIYTIHGIICNRILNVYMNTWSGNMGMYNC